jgi:FSR family fosmidomycin resistance protein-like MFS transporter
MNWKFLILLSLGHLIVDLNTGGLPAFLPFLKEALDLSYTMTAAIILTFNVTSSVIQPIFGFLSDRHSMKWLLPLGCLVAPLGLGLIGFCPSFSWLLFVVAISGLGQACYHPESFKTANLVSGGKKASAISVFHFGGNLGFAISPILATLFFRWMGLKGSAFFILPGLAMTAVFLATSDWKMPGEPRGVKASSPQGRQGLRSQIFPMVLLFLVVILRSATRLGLITFVPFYILKVLNQDPLVAGKFLSIFLLMGTIGIVTGGPLADRYGYKLTTILGLALAPATLYLFSITAGLAALIFFGAAGFLLISSNSVTMAMGQSFLPQNIAMASALVLGFSLGIGGIATTIFGWVADHWGVSFTLHLIFLLPLLAVAILFFIPDPSRKES